MMNNELLDTEQIEIPTLRTYQIDLAEAYIFMVCGGLFLYLNYINLYDSIYFGGIKGKTIGDSLGIIICLGSPLRYIYLWRKQSLQIDKSNEKWAIEIPGLLTFFILIEILSCFLVGVMNLSLERMAELYGEEVFEMGLLAIFSGLVLVYYLLATKRQELALMNYIENLSVEEQKKTWIEK